MPKLKISSCTVVLLDGKEIIVDNYYLHNCEALLNYVCQQIGTSEPNYFGLRYVNPKDGKISWLDVKKPLQKQLKKASRRFKVGIQFFPETIHSLQDEVTRYQFVLQTREYLLSGLWSCSVPTQALLASYIIQAEYGDYDSETHDKNYLDELQFTFNQSEDFLEKVSLFHRNHKNLMPTDADWLYMKTASKMVLFGMDVFDVKDADGNSMSLAVNAFGIHILHMNTILHTFFWSIISKVHCHGKEIIVNLKVSSKDQAESVCVSFICPSILDAKRILKSSNSYKSFAHYGSVKKAMKRSQKHVICSHVSTRLLAKDFERVTSSEYATRFLRQSGEDVRRECLDGVKDRIDSMDQESGKDAIPSESQPLETPSIGSEDQCVHEEQWSENILEESFSPVSSINEDDEKRYNGDCDHLTNGDVTKVTSTGGEEANDVSEKELNADVEEGLNGVVDTQLNGHIDKEIDGVVNKGGNEQLNDGVNGSVTNEYSDVNEDDPDVLIIEKSDIESLIKAEAASLSLTCSGTEKVEDFENSYELVTEESLLES